MATSAGPTFRFWCGLNPIASVWPVTLDRVRRTLPLGLLVVSLFLAAPVHAQDEGDEGTVTGGADAPPVTLPLVPVPTGCEAPRMPHIVFIGEVVERDYRTVRFSIERVRSGRPDPFATNGLVDVRYGLDAQYLDDGELYLVSAVVDPDLGFLVSRTTPPIEHFGGDEVIGVSETDVDCPDYEDPMRTLHPGGTEIDGGVLEPLLDSKVRIAGSFLIPFAVATGVIFVLAMFRLSLAGLYHSIVDGGRRRASP
jgi:hypothetical protein